MDDDGDSHTRWPACHRCHSSKLRCRRAPSQRACTRCIRAQVECSPRPSRRGQGQGQQQRALDSSIVVSSANTQPFSVNALPRPPNPLDSRASGLDPMLQAVDEVAWPNLLAEPGLSTSPLNPPPYTDFFQLPLDMTFEPQDMPGHSPTQTQRQGGNQITLTSEVDGALLAPRSTGTTRRLDARVHELARLNMLLVNQQEAAAESIHALRNSSLVSSPSGPLPPPEESPEGPGQEEDGTHRGRQRDYLNLEETLRIALQLSSILRQSGPAHDPATALLLLSCYSRLAAIFREVFDCFQPILDNNKSSGGGASPGLLSRLFPRVQLGGSLCLGGSGGGSGRLQAEMVLDASERVFADISARMEVFVVGDRRGDAGATPVVERSPSDDSPKSRRSTISDVLEEGICIVREERLAFSELVGRLRRALSEVHVGRL